jgi:hypothetical protein
MSLVEKPAGPVYSIRQLSQKFKQAPFYLISTHGAYNLDREVPVFKVPENTYIFETQFITDLCLTTIDEPLFNLLQGVNRDAFNYYFLNEKAGNENYKGNIAIAPGNEFFDGNTYRNTVQHLIMYGPGDMIPIREITIGRVGPSSRFIYAGMTLNRFEPGQKAVKFPGTKETLLLHERGLLHDQLISGKEMTNQEVIEEILEMPIEKERKTTQPRVFFFSSCAAVTELPKTNEQKQRLMLLESTQRQQILKLLASGIYSVLGGPGTLSTEPVEESRMTLSRPGKISESFVSIKAHGPHEMMTQVSRPMLNNLVPDSISSPASRITRATKPSYLYKHTPAIGNKPESWKPFMSSSGKPALLRNNVKNIIKKYGRNNIFEYNAESKTLKKFKGGRRRTIKKRHQ